MNQKELDKSWAKGPGEYIYALTDSYLDAVGGSLTRFR